MPCALQDEFDNFSEKMTSTGSESEAKKLYFLVKWLTRRARNSGGTYNLRVTPPQRVVLLGSHDVYGSYMILPSTSKSHSNFVKGTFVASHGPRWVFPVDRFGEANWRKVSYQLFLQTPCSTCVEKLLCEVYRHVGTVWRYMIYMNTKKLWVLKVWSWRLIFDLIRHDSNVSLVDLRATCNSGP